MSKVLVLATSRKTRGGVTSVVKAHETGEQWKKYHCRWIETHRDGSILRKLWYLGTSLLGYILLLPFYDVVHIHFSLIPSAKRKYIFFYLARLLRKKIIIQLHCGSQIDEIWSSLYYKMFTQADVALVLSEVLKRDVEKYTACKSDLRVLYNPCPEVHYLPIEKKKQILFAGTLYEGKGYMDLIKAFARIAHQYPDWKIVFAGNGEVERGKALAKELNIENQTVFLGWVNGEAKDKAFREATIFCLPSYAEGFPMAVLDAWAYGLPVITTPVGGIPDIAKDGENMLLFQPGDIAALSYQLEEMISNETLRNKIAAESRQLAATTFNLTTINRQLGDLYRGLS